MTDETLEKRAEALKTGALDAWEHFFREVYAKTSPSEVLPEAFERVVRVLREIYREKIQVAVERDGLLGMPMPVFDDEQAAKAARNLIVILSGVIEG